MTNRNLKNVVAENGFRGNLYYRLNRFPIEIPPFRDRSSDIDPLSTYFLRRAAEELGKTPPVLSGDAIKVLQSYRWLGNARELENAMERMAILCERVSLLAKTAVSPKCPTRRPRKGPRTRPGDEVEQNAS